MQGRNFFLAIGLFILAVTFGLSFVDGGLSLRVVGLFLGVPFLGIAIVEHLTGGIDEKRF